MQMNFLFLAVVVFTAALTPDWSAGQASALGWQLPEAREVQLGGPLGEAYARGTQRLSQPPYDSPSYLRSDFSFETNRIFVNYSGDISGRFIQITSLISSPGQTLPPALSAVLQDFAKYQKADGHFGREVDWSRPLEPENSNATLLPIFWGNGRLLVGLIEAYRAFGRPDCLAAAKHMGDFYIATADRFLDPAREPEYRMTGTYAAGYVTDYFPGIEGLALLYQTTRDERVAPGRTHGGLLQAVRHLAHRPQPRQPHYPLWPAAPLRNHRQGRIPGASAGPVANGD